MAGKPDLRILLAGAAVGIALSNGAAAEIAAAPSTEARVRAFNALLMAGDISATPKKGRSVGKQFEREGFARDGNNPPESDDANAAVRAHRVSEPHESTASVSDTDPGFDREGGHGADPNAEDERADTEFDREGGELSAPF